MLFECVLIWICFATVLYQKNNLQQKNVCINEINNKMKIDFVNMSNKKNVKKEKK